MINGWNKFVREVMEVIEGTCHTNDLGRHETQDKLESAVTELARANGIDAPEFDYDSMYEDVSDA